METATSMRIKLIVFDLDGVLFSSKDLHYLALNRALETIDPKYAISYQDHLDHFDGLPTNIKLEKMTAERGLPVADHKKIWELKQEQTFEVIRDTFVPDLELRQNLLQLKKAGYMVYCASNSIYKTIQLMLLKKGILDLFDYIVSCEDVRFPKPSPAVYLYTCLRAGCSPKETIVLEDSQVGRKAALLSGCHLLPIEVPANVTAASILPAIELINRHQSNFVMRVKWRRPLNVVIPMNKQVPPAHVPHAYRTYAAEIKHNTIMDIENPDAAYPVYLSIIGGSPVIQHVVENLNVEATFTFIVPRADYDRYQLKYMLSVLRRDCNIIVAEGQTSGQAATILLAKTFIDNDQPILIANCTQLLDWDSNAFLYAMDDPLLHGGILTFKSQEPRYSYVKMNGMNTVTEIHEKKVVSNLASAGIYYWKRGSDFVRFATKHVKDPSRMVENAFFVSGVYADAIAEKMTFRAIPCKAYVPLGTTNDIERLSQSSNGGTQRALSKLAVDDFILKSAETERVDSAVMIEAFTGAFNLEPRQPGGLAV
ncbi:hypothetical protein HDU88_002317 [Geranomyces variabilis]|nr:hypothetical protein HDU88_002317 [Geranomyces variabilis]